MSKVIFGGTFDPVHIGHVGVVQKLRQAYDEVVVMPCALSPFKTATRATDGDRLAMCRLAFSGMDGVSVSDYEIARGGVSYTADTLRAFPDCAFSVGGDSFLSLGSWREADYLATREVALVARGDGALDEAIRIWRARGGRVRLLGKEPEVSSTVVRLKIGLGLPCEELSEAVADYVRAHRLYAAYGEYFTLYERFGLKPSRIEHTKGVALTALLLAMRYGVDEEKAVDAALLHDLAKYVSPAQCKELGVALPEFVFSMPPPVQHAFVGAELAEQLLGRSAEIGNAIRYHTTARPAMTDLEKIVCLADYIEPNRDFCGLEDVRAAAERGLDEAVCKMLEKTLAYLSGAREEIAPLSVEAYEYYKNLKKD